MASLHFAQIISDIAYGKLVNRAIDPSAHTNVQPPPTLGRTQPQAEASTDSLPKKRRSTRSCDSCRKLHVACDGNEPCACCITRQKAQCTYQPQKKRGPLPKDRTALQLQQAIEGADQMSWQPVIEPQSKKHKKDGSDKLTDGANAALFDSSTRRRMTCQSTEGREFTIRERCVSFVEPMAAHRASQRLTSPPIIPTETASPAFTIAIPPAAPRFDMERNQQMTSLATALPASAAAVLQSAWLPSPPAATAADSITLTRDQFFQVLDWYKSPSSSSIIALQGDQFSKIQSWLSSRQLQRQQKE